MDVRFGEEDNPDKNFHPCKGLFNTCCTLRSDKPIIPVIVKKEGCGHRNFEGVGFRVTDRDNESQFGETEQFKVNLDGQSFISFHLC